MPRKWNRITALAGLAAGTWAAATCSSGTDATPDFSVTTDPVPATTLGTQETVHVHLASTGLAGGATVTVTGAPANWTVTPPGAPVNLTANGQALADVIVAIPSNGDAAPSGDTLAIAATIGANEHVAKAVVTVANEFVAPIQLGAIGGAHWGSISGDTIHLSVGTLVTFRNNDTTLHVIHAGGSIGIAHQNVSGGTLPGGVYQQTISTFGSDKIWCHVHASDTLYFVVP